MADGKDDELERFLTEGDVATVNLDASTFLAFADPYDRTAAQEIGSVTALNIRVVRAFDDALLLAFARCY